MNYYGGSSDAGAVSALEYDALGQLKKKKLGNKPGSSAGTALTSLDYEYNIRGWLLSLNKSYITATSNSDQYFGMQLGYDKDGALGTFANKQFNGNISGTLWKSEGDKQQREYDFSYDAVNRLTGALFGQYESGASSTAVFNTVAGVNFTVENLAYDANGNIKSMRQYGLKGVTSTVVDDMIYTYMPNSNKLQNVQDGSNDALSKLGDFKTLTLHPQNTLKANATTQSLREGITDYTYDANGNLTKDLNKDIATPTGFTGITYNHLNLPTQILIKKDNFRNIKGSISYTYDAAGNKLKKVTYDIGTVGKTITTTPPYLIGFVYESKTTVPANTPADDYTDRLQFLPQEEGRIRFNPLVGTTPASFEYDYFIKDHLGNVRMVLTEELKPDIYPTLSLEGASGSAEVNNQNAIWEKADGTPFNVVGSRTSISQLVNATGLVPSTLANSLLVRSSTGKVGAGKLIKVMSGDKINTTVQYYFSQNTESNPTNNLNTLVTGLASVLLNSSSTLAALKSNPAAIASSVNIDQNAIDFFTPQNTATNNGRPKAYLNVLFFDEQFKFDNTSSYGEQITTTNPGQIVIALGSARQAKKNGYCYIYISNETNDMVYFDNFTLKHDRGPILEETHYYPFGLTMAGISSKAAGGIENKKKYQQYELNSDFDLNLYESFYRTHDPQLGRFWQIDPKPSDYESPYTAMGNNPILNFDLLGDTTYRFNQSTGAYIGMFDLDAAGQVGSYGANKSIGKGKNKQEVWKGQRFEFADPVTDAQQIRDEIIDKLVFVSNDDIKGILTGQGAFNYDDKNNLFTFYRNSKGGAKF